MKKIAETIVPINDVISKRWSPRAFDSNHVIDDNLIKSLFEAARWAPSCYGDQPWQFILFKKEDTTSWVGLLNCLSVGNQNWAMDTSIIIVVCANKNFNHNNEPNRWAQYDTGAAAENSREGDEGPGLLEEDAGEDAEDEDEDEYKDPAVGSSHMV